VLNEEEKWYRVSLRLTGDGVEPDEVTAALGLEPTYSARKGDHFRQNPRYMVHRSNIWTHSVTADSNVPFEEQIPSLLDQLEARSVALDDLLDRADVEAELFLGFSSGDGQGGTFFPPGLLSRIGALGLALDLDLYPPSPSFALRRYERVRALK
jgi:hypothetical protein